MATRTERCKWCRVQLVLPFQAQSVRCPVCLNLNILQNNYSPTVPLNVPRPQQLPSPPVYGSKRAVLCGVSYHGHQKSLSGSVNDVRSMRNFLMDIMKFPNASIIVLSEEESSPFQIPTKRNIQMALRWLVEGCKPGDSLVFHFSGHASRVRDNNWDEIDRYDEALSPVDFATEGKILDDEINATIVRPLPHGATLHAINDTCFSGTLLDLPFMCRMNHNEGKYIWEDHRNPYAAYKGTNGGIAVSFSACDDHQNSGDTTAFTGNATGALTYSFIQAIRSEPNLTYRRLLGIMRHRITEAQKAHGLMNHRNLNCPLQSGLTFTRSVCCYRLYRKNLICAKPTQLL